MQLNNYQILEYFKNLKNNLEEENLYIPVKANFLIHKNMALLESAVSEIEKSRLEIAQHYGQLDEQQQQFLISSENIEEANQEITNLFSIEQNLDIKLIKLEDLGSINFTPKQMQAIMFMIED